MTHLLVTNDFPPKVGGIQSYLWELWRRLPAGEAHVLTTSYPGAVAFDRAQPFGIERLPVPVLLPTPSLARHVDRAARRAGADLVLLDPALPLGLIGPSLHTPYGVVLHGAEVTVPGRLPLTSPLLAHVLQRAQMAIAAGCYPAEEARRVAGARLPAVTVVPPGVDTNRFRPLPAERRAQVRRRLGIRPDARLVVSVSRLVPRKGMDVLIHAAARLAPGRPDVVVAVAGSGRDRPRLEHLAAAAGAPVRLIGRVPDADLADFYGCGDVFAMVCRNRWAGLEQEGFGIVFLEAAACAVPQVAGNSGGAAEAVVDGETGLVVDRPGDVDAVTAALAELLDDPARRRAMGKAARRRAEAEFGYDGLARRLSSALAGVAG